MNNAIGPYDRGFQEGTATGNVNHVAFQCPGDERAWKDYHEWHLWRLWAGFEIQQDSRDFGVTVCLWTGISFHLELLLLSLSGGLHLAKKPKL